jgi:hypothetical protein
VLQKRPAAAQGQGIMKHVSTRIVFDYWTKQRGPRPAPDRADIDPTEIRHALGDTFMLAADFVDQLRFRLAGTRVCALFNREIKGEAFTNLWREDNRAAIEELLRVVTAEATGAVAGLTALSEEGAQADLEMLLLPLAHSGHARIRALGVLAPTVPPYWLGAQAVTELTLNGLRYIDAQGKPGARPGFGLAAAAGRVRHGFVVYNGGRESPSTERAG